MQKKKCGETILLKSDGTGPTINYYGKCGGCGVRYTRTKDAKSGKVTDYYFEEQQDNIELIDHPHNNDKK